MAQAPTDSFDPGADDLPNANSCEGAKKRRDPNQPAAVVGLGASAGGVGPLQQFFEEMPAESGLAFVVVMHLSPEHESNLAAVIQPRTAMPVMQVNEPVKVRPNHVYVIPPNKQLTFEDSTLTLVEPQQAQGRRVTIDLFFRTLAQSYGQRSVSIILSGTDSDGVIGLKHIRAQGGVTIAQEPNEAEHDSMPLSAIATGMVDWVLPVAQMPPRLMDFVKNEHLMELPPEIPESSETDAKDRTAPGGETVSDETRDPSDEAAVTEVLAHLLAATGHDFGHYKRATVLRRIARRMQVNSIENVPDYVKLLRVHQTEAGALLSDLLIGVTHFFRDQEAFAALEANVPQLFAGKPAEDEIRVWVIGCATGEEAYSVAMLLCEQADRLDYPPKIQVFATDLDDQAILDARQGIFPSTIEADVSPERLKRFFLRDQGRYRVKKELREKVLFASHNVLNDAPFSRIDLVTCRNLLIYLKANAQDQVFDIAHFALRAGGLLFIGSAETATNLHMLFSPIDPHHRIYVRRSVPRPSWQIPIIPPQTPQLIRRQRLRSQRMILPPLMPGRVREAATDTVASASSGHERRATLFGELHLKLLEQYGPPSVVVNQTYDIIHLSEKAGRYLQFGGGEATANILNVVHPALRVELRAALFRVAQEETARSTTQAVEVGGETEMISMQVRKARETDAAQGFYLVTFEKQEAGHAAAPAQELPSDVSQHLDHEVQVLRQQLSTTIENYEAANEELKASNEELQAVNEELRSTTEELETSKEELQSVNEELITVNAELKSSVEELSRTNNDLNNLMASTQIGTIFVDRQLRIQRFTPAAQKVFNLLPTDTGRPLGDITHKLRYDGLIADGHKVLDDLVPIDKEVDMLGDGWFLVRVAPYRTGDDRIAGVVVTFIDITRRKKAEDELRESEARLRRSFEIETVGVLFFTNDGRIVDANDAFLKMTGYTRDDLEKGRLRWDVMTAPEFMGRSLQAIEEFTRTGKITTYENQYIRKDGTRWWGLFTATRLTDELGVEYILDISDRKETERALKESEARFREFADNSADVLWMMKAETRQVEYVSPAYEGMFGQPRQSGIEHLEQWRELIHPDDREAVLASIDRLLAGETVPRDYRIIRPDGQMRWIRDVGFPIRDENGKVVRISGIAQDITNERERRDVLTVTKERFELLVEGAREYAMFLLDPSNTITYWSKGAERVFGWTAEEAVGQSGELVFTPEDRAREEEEKEIETALRDGTASDRRWHIRKDGTRIWVDGVMRRLDDEKTGALRGFAKIARDATRQRQAEEELTRAQEELETRVRERTAELERTNAKLRQAIEQRQMLEKQILRITEQERARISQDLHDSLCQELTATAFLLKSRAKAIAAENRMAADSLIEAAETVNSNAGIARDLARGLHPMVLGESGLPSALRELCSRNNEIVSCRCDCPNSLRLEQSVALNLYRIAQEAVSNSVKHANANEIAITLERTNRELVMTVSDDGKAKRRRGRGRGLGTHIMQYRARAIGGTLKMESTQGRGTTVTCRVPLKQ